MELIEAHKPTLRTIVLIQKSNLVIVLQITLKEYASCTILPEFTLSYAFVREICDGDVEFYA